MRAGTCCAPVAPPRTARPRSCPAPAGRARRCRMWPQLPLRPPAHSRPARTTMLRRHNTVMLHCMSTHAAVHVPMQIAMHSYEHHVGGATDRVTSSKIMCHAQAHLQAPGVDLPNLHLLQCQHCMALPPQAAARVQYPAPMQPAQRLPRRLPSPLCPGCTRSFESTTCHHHVPQVKVCNYLIFCTRPIPTLVA